MIQLINEILPSKSERVYFAVSMGVDSLAACFYLGSKGYNLAPIHFNHKLRPQNDEMEKKFNKLFPWGSQNGSASINPKKTEADCRQDRLEFFKYVCKKEGSSDGPKIIISAHHLDDYVESYLLNCFRGQPEYKPMNLISDFGSFKIIHPFLLTEKKDFIQFAEKWKKGWLKEWIVQDETNSVIKGSRRNWIRNVIIPEMEKQKMSLKKHCKNLIINSIEKL